MHLGNGSPLAFNNGFNHSTHILKLWLKFIHIWIARIVELGFVFELLSLEWPVPLLHLLDNAHLFHKFSLWIRLVSLEKDVWLIYFVKAFDCSLAIQLDLFRAFVVGLVLGNRVHVLRERGVRFRLVDWWFGYSKVFWRILYSLPWYQRNTIAVALPGGWSTVELFHSFVCRIRILLFGLFIKVMLGKETVAFACCGI